MSSENALKSALWCKYVLLQTLLITQAYIMSRQCYVENVISRTHLLALAKLDWPSTFDSNQWVWTTSWRNVAQQIEKWLARCYLKNALVYSVYYNGNLLLHWYRWTTPGLIAKHHLIIIRRGDRERPTAIREKDKDTQTRDIIQREKGQCHLEASFAKCFTYIVFDCILGYWTLLVGNHESPQCDSRKMLLEILLVIWALLLSISSTRMHIQEYFSLMSYIA